jgi:hypothetical protein
MERVGGSESPGNEESRTLTVCAAMVAGYCSEWLFETVARRWCRQRNAHKDAQDIRAEPGAKGTVADEDEDEEGWRLTLLRCPHDHRSCTGENLPFRFKSSSLLVSISQKELGLRASETHFRCSSRSLMTAA